MNTILIIAIILGATNLWVEIHKLRHPEDRTPKVIVNMPADAKPWEQLQTNDTIVAPEHAALWWTVFNRVYTHGGVEDAIYAANEAVETVYRNRA